MRRAIRWAVVLLFLPLIGCSQRSEQRNAQSISNSSEPRPTVPLIAGSGAEARIEQVRTEAIQANNETQQNLQALVAAQVGKVAEKLSVAEGDLVRLQAEVRNSLSVQSELRAQLDAQVKLSNRMSLRADLHAEAAADLRLKVGELQTQLNAQAAAMGSAVAGIANRTESQQQTSTAGRDSTVRNSTQFTADMASMIVSITERWALMLVCVVLLQSAVFSFVVCFAFERSRRRAEQRAQQLWERKGETSYA